VASLQRLRSVAPAMSSPGLPDASAPAGSSAGGPRQLDAGARRRWLPPLLLAAGTLSWLWVTATAPPRTGRQLLAWSTRNLAIGLVLGWAAAFATLRARSRRALLAGMLATVLAAATLLLLELIGWLGLVDWATLFHLRHVAPLGSVRLPDALVRGEGKEDIAALWHLPSAPIAFEYRTDHLGFRNLHDRDSAQLYCLGDSFLVAGLLPIESTVTALLERELGVPTMSLGLIGLGVQEEQRLWREAALPVQDCIVLQFVTEDNDLVDSARFRAGRNNWDIHSPSAHSFVDSLVLWLQRCLQPTPGEAHTHVGSCLGQQVAFQWDRGSFAGLDREVDAVLDCITGLHAEIAAAGGRHAVVLIPSKLRVLGPRCTWPEDSALRELDSQLGPLPVALARRCSEQGIPLFDLTDTLVQVAAHELPYFCLDTHWNAAGHAAVARALAGWSFVRGR